MHIAKAVVIAIAATAGIEAAQAQTIQPQNFPPSFTYPLPAATIDGWLAAHNQTAIRGRAWELWGAMATRSGYSLNGANLPIWETWWGAEELFPANATCQPAVTAASAPRQPTRYFIDPNQFTHQANGARRRITQAAAPPNPTPSDFQVVSFNKFNGAYGTFIMASQPGPGGPYCYRSGKSLSALADAFAAAGAAGAAHKINDFPAPAIATKPVMGVVKASGYTVLPVWRGPDDSTNPTHPEPSTWQTCVVINPSLTQIPAGSPDPSIIPSAPTLACARYSWATLSQLYNFPMNAAEAAAFNQAQPSGGAAAGDFAVLFAMHVTTKETPFWTWQTFYWQPNGDTPNGFPGSKANQPTSLPSPWNNYAMCAAYSQTTPPASSTMTVCFNPYLETSKGIDAGITSNCMSCHGVAQVGPNSNYPASYSAPISFFTDPTHFTPSAANKFVITDFSWATAGAK